MLTVCWALKGGSGTSTVAAASAAGGDAPTLLVDLDGDQPAVLGIAAPSGPGVADWLRSDAPVERLRHLEVGFGERRALLPLGTTAPSGTDPRRWQMLARHLRDDARHVVVDAGTGAPPPALLDVATQRWIVTRPCYLALRRASPRSAGVDRGATGVVLVDEPGRVLRIADVETALGAPVVAALTSDPAVARAVDAGLLASRLPRAMTRSLHRALRDVDEFAA